MSELYHEFPNLENEAITIRKMAASDAPALYQISNSDAVYRYISPFLYQKSLKLLETAIGHLGGRDFEKKKAIIAGVYLQREPDRLIGLAEMFGYKKRTNSIMIGYRINDAFWNQGIATSTIDLMVQYLIAEIGLDRIEAHVMPENIYSSKALLKNGFQKERDMVQEKKLGWTLCC